jgi:hypothetical protein
MYGIKRRESCGGVFEIHKILTMTSLYILEVLCYIKKSSEFIIYNSQLHNYNTRGKNDFHVAACNTAWCRKSLINLGIKLFNRLPERIKNLKTFKQFKREVKSLFEHNAFNSSNEYLHLSVCME